MKKFNDLIREQFAYGGKKYALSTEKESTDQLFDDFGRGWLLGTMAKYVYRTKNLARERDILKIACYVYILWLKRGFHIRPRGLDTDVIDTTVEIKALHFDSFTDNVGKSFLDPVRSDWLRTWQEKHPDTKMIDTIGWELKDWNKKEWSQITELDLRWMYIKCYLVWKDSYADAKTHDTDTQES